ncbi:MAG: NADAR family protein [Hyperionvirus sp.]|uniref:NADAR family protein n=1 Tax=Hyperionvirus sp. TaxID=2487770 RepID=A0A3G5AFG5_9VIRU|nr:MAG: NADAR family protein [Hyperionvirus sp.]
MEPIYFYSTKKNYYEFSNFYPAAITVDGKVWPTSEHYYAAQKFAGNDEYQENIRLARTPALAKKLGSTKKLRLRADWESVKDGIMDKALNAKFTQHEKLKKLLLSTENRNLIEDSKKDSYWGIGNGAGQNKLGLALVKLREQLKKLNI